MVIHLILTRTLLCNSSLRFSFGYAGIPFGPEDRLTRALNEDFYFPSVPLRFSFGYAGLLQVSEKWVLEFPQKGSKHTWPHEIHPAPIQNPLQPGGPQNLLNGPSVTKGFTMKISFGFPSVFLRSRGLFILGTFGQPGASWKWLQHYVPQATGSSA